MAQKCQTFLSMPVSAVKVQEGTFFYCMHLSPDIKKN
jgi:hypothetical protein